MPLYLCRWENGDFSVVQASNQEHAIEMLDEEADAEGMPLYAISDFMVHFRLTDEGTVELEGFGEFFDDYVREHVHPVLGALGISSCDATPEEITRVREAVKMERKRVKAKEVPDPDTELGKQIGAQLDMPTSIVNRHIRTETKKLLEKSKPKGKPS